MENRRGLIVDTETTRATGWAERAAAEAMIEAVAPAGGVTLGADKAYDTAEHVANLRRLGVTPHVAQNPPSRLRHQPEKAQTDRGAVRLDEVQCRLPQDTAPRAGPGRMDVHPQGRRLQPGSTSPATGSNDRMNQLPQPPETTKFPTSSRRPSANPHSQAGPFVR